VNQTYTGKAATSAVSPPGANSGGSADSRSKFTPLSPADEEQVNQVIAGATHVWMTHIEAGVLDNDGAEVVVYAALIGAIDKSDDCYHDSGSNRHVFHRRESFDEYTEIQPVRVHAFGEGLTIAAIGAGSVKLQGSYKGILGNFTLTNCLHVPAAHANLISQVRLDKFGVSTYFDDGRVTLFKEDIPCVDGSIHNDMYRLNMWSMKTGAQDHEGAISMMAKATGDAPDFCTA